MRPEPNPSHADRQTAIAAALLDTGCTICDGLVAPGGGPVDRRFAVHRATTTLSSIAALAARHPVLERLLGAETFADLTRAFLRVDRPRTARLLGWGDRLPDFVAAHPDLVDWPWLADVARLEVAWNAAHHAAEAMPMSLGDLVASGAESLATARLALHPSLHLLTSPWSVVSVWATNGEGTEVKAEMERIMVLRPDDDVVVHALGAAAFAFVVALEAGATVAEAATEVERVAVGFDVGTHLIDLVRRGAVVAIMATDGEGDVR